MLLLITIISTHLHTHICTGTLHFLHTQVTNVLHYVTWLLPIAKICALMYSTPTYIIGAN